MDSRKIVYTETAVVAIGQTVCVLVMLALFALAGSFDASVLLGGILGGVLAILNFFFMAIGASLAADKAEAQDVADGDNGDGTQNLIAREQAAVDNLLFGFTLYKMNEAYRHTTAKYCCKERVHNAAHLIQYT